jgi:hypothetical protein
LITFVFAVVGTPPIKTTGSLGTWFGLMLVFTGPLRIVDGEEEIERVGVGVGVGVADGVEGELEPPPDETGSAGVALIEFEAVESPFIFTALMLIE